MSDPAGEQGDPEADVADLIRNHEERENRLEKEQCLSPTVNEHIACRGDGGVFARVARVLKWKRNSRRREQPAAACSVQEPSGLTSATTAPPELEESDNETTE